MSDKLATQKTVAEVADKVRGSLLDDMSAAYGLSRAMLVQTLKRTIFPNGAGTDEQVAAFCAVAQRYELDPFLKEIYAFPAKGGGIVPIVSVDGWYKIINRHPEMDGVETDEVRDGAGKLQAVRCTIWRKDRAHPTAVTEYLAECKRNTDPWNNQPTRMLRHRAITQCARIVFGFGGIFTPEEGEAIAHGGREPSEKMERLNRQIAGASGIAGALPVATADESSDADAEHEPAPESAGEVGLDLFGGAQ